MQMLPSVGGLILDVGLVFVCGVLLHLLLLVRRCIEKHNEAIGQHTEMLTDTREAILYHDTRLDKLEGLDDGERGGLEMSPIEFDNADVTTPFLNGEIFPDSKHCPAVKQLNELNAGQIRQQIALMKPHDPVFVICTNDPLLKVAAVRCYPDTKTPDGEWESCVKIEVERAGEDDDTD